MLGMREDTGCAVRFIMLFIDDVLLVSTVYQNVYQMLQLSRSET